VISGANTHDVKLLQPTLEAVVVDRPEAPPPSQQHLCADAGYTGVDHEQTIRSNQYIAHIRSRGEERQHKMEGYKPRRWVVEVAFSWLNRFRGLLIRWNKKDRYYLAFLMFACAIIAWRKTIIVHPA